MSDERYQRVKDIFLEVCDLDPSARGPIIEQRCGGDASLRAEVERMLSSDAGTMAGRLDVPASGANALSDAAKCADTHTPHTSIPARIGHYEVLAELGRGGMGIVYEARQENPRRRVALKVLHPAFASGSILKRFELEAHLLGQLEHPGIAHVYEAGSVETGGARVPFIAMELIDGPALTRYADEHALATPLRLELLARVCDAVHHAHQRGVIHRDLKPANILVATGHATKQAEARFAGLGQPKVLDFGVARATGLETQMTTIQTGEAQLIGTLAYMSPEQVAADPAKIDLRSDVYALGAVLLELLTGRPPHDLTSCTMFEAVRRIREDEPDRAATISRTLRGDIDTIISKALERDPDRRYQSAAELADDLRRHLRSEPIVARRASTAYQLRKFARRNKALVTGVAVAFVGMAAGMGVSVWKAIDATRERDNALDANRRELAVNSFYNNDILRAASPKALGRDVTVREALDVAVSAIGPRFAGDPLVEARVHHAAGQTYAQLGENEKARQQLSLALELLEPIAPAHAQSVLESRAELAKALINLGETAEAESLALETRAMAIQAHGPDSRMAAYTTDALALVYIHQDRFDEAIGLTERQIEILSSLDGPEHPDTLTVRTRLASAYIYADQKERAESELNEICDILDRVMGPDHPTTLTNRANLGALYLQTRRHEEAEAIYTALLPVEERVLGPEHPDTQISRQNLAVVYNRTQRYDLARPLMEQTLDAQIQASGERHPNAIVGMANLSLLCFNMGDHEAALATADRALTLSRQVLGPTHHVTIELLYNHARPLRELGRLAESADSYEELIELTVQTRGQTHPRTIHFTRERAQVLTSAEQYENAEAGLLRATSLYDQRIASGEAPIELIALGIRRAFAELYTAWGRPDDAARYADPNPAP